MGDQSQDGEKKQERTWPSTSVSALWPLLRANLNRVQVWLVEMTLTVWISLSSGIASKSLVWFLSCPEQLE